MMKKMKKSLVLLLLLIPFHVRALTGSIAVTCDKTKVSPGDTISCSIRGTAADDSVPSVSAKLKLSSNLTLGNVVVDSSWQGDGEGGNIDLYTDSNKTGTFNIATFTATVSSSISGGTSEKITLDTVKFSGSDFNEVDIAGTSLGIDVLSGINTASSITISSGTLSPAFNPNVMDYSATVKADKVTISATRTDDKSTLSGNIGEVSLNYGANTFKINVVSQSGATRTYSIVITRPDERDTDNKLASLLVNNKSVDLIDGQTSYVYEVENNVTVAEIGAVLNSESSVFLEDFGPRSINLVEGENRVEIKVKAENGEEVTYTLIINRKKAETTNDGTSNSANNSQINNPKTGMGSFYIIVLIVLLSGISMFCFYQVYQEKTGRNNKA